MAEMVYNDPLKVKESPYAEKVERNIKKLALSYKYKDGFDTI